MSSAIQCLERSINPNIADYRDSDLRICLSLQQHSLSLGISANENRTPLALAAYALDTTSLNYLECIRELISGEKLLDPSFHYGKRTFHVSDFKSSLIPEKLYEPEHGKDYLASLFRLNGKECITREAEPNTRSFILTAFNPNYLKAVQTIFSNDSQIGFFSIYACLIRELFRVSHTYKRFSHHVLLHVRKNEFDLCVKNDDGLLFLNSFPYPDFDNLLYYFLYALNKLKIDMGAVALYLCGLASEQNLLPRLEEQVYAITYLPAPAQVRFTKEMPYDRYFTCL